MCACAVVWAALIVARAAGAIDMPWPIVLLPAWGPPALYVAARLAVFGLAMVLGILAFAWALVFG